MVDKLDTFRARGRPLVAWLYTIARNLVTDVHRQNGRAIHLSLDEALHLDGGGQADLARGLDRRGRGFRLLVLALSERVA